MVPISVCLSILVAFHASRSASIGDHREAIGVPLARDSGGIGYECTHSVRDGPHLARDRFVPREGFIVGNTPRFVTALYGVELGR